MILSSHLVSDLERVCDYLIVLVASRVRVAGDGRRPARQPPPAHRRPPRRGRPARRRRGDRGQPHRPAVDLHRAQRRPDRRPGLDRRTAHPRRPGAGLHVAGRQPRTGPHWRAPDDLVHLAPVPRPGLRSPRSAWSRSASCCSSAPAASPTCTPTCAACHSDCATAIDNFLAQVRASASGTVYSRQPGRHVRAACPDRACSGVRR